MERPIGLLFIEIFDRVVQFFGEKRLGFFGVSNGLLHLLLKLVELAFLLGEFLDELFARIIFAKALRLGGFLCFLVELFADLLFLLVERSRLFAEVSSFAR